MYTIGCGYSEKENSQIVSGPQAEGRQDIWMGVFTTYAESLMERLL